MKDIGVRNTWIGLLYWFEELDGTGEASVRAMVDFWLEADASNGTPGLGPGLVDIHVEGARVMPCETDEYGTAVLLLQDAVDHTLGTVEIGFLHREGGGGTSNTAAWRGRESLCAGDGGKEEGGTSDLHGCFGLRCDGDWMDYEDESNNMNTNPFGGRIWR